jgi:group I intron endonuclease
MSGDIKKGQSYIKYKLLKKNVIYIKCLTYKMIDEINDKNCTVYMLIFTNGKKYIGITTRSPEERRREHIYCSRNKTPKYILHKSIKLYGENSFDMIILETTTNVSELKLLEQKYIQEHNTYFQNGLGYNMTLGGEGNFGYKFTDEIKMKMSLIRKELIKDNPEILEKFKKSMKNYWTEEKRLAMSIHKKEYYINNPEAIEKWKESRGEWTDEQRTNHSLIVKEKFKNDPERAKNISKRMKIHQNTLEGKIRGTPKPFNVHKKNGEYIGTYDYVPFAVNDILNERKLLSNITEKCFGSSIRRVLSGKRTHTKCMVFKYIQ